MPELIFQLSAEQTFTERNEEIKLKLLIHIYSLVMPNCASLDYFTT